MGQIIIEGRPYKYNQSDIAKRLGLSRMTVNRALAEGEYHPQYRRVMKTINEMVKQPFHNN